jgi:hypothetical protein
MVGIVACGYIGREIMRRHIVWTAEPGSCPQIAPNTSIGRIIEVASGRSGYIRCDITWLSHQRLRISIGACGFLVLFQRQLADAVNVPLFTSSLIQLPVVHRMLRSDRKVGLLVAKKRSLTRRHLEAIGAADIPVCVASLDEAPEFREVILEGRRVELYAGRLEGEVLSAVEMLARENPDMGALVIECTDLPPFAHAVQKRLGLPVLDIVALTEMVYRTPTRRPYGVRGATA